jgi:predicted Zn-dependent protease
MPVLLLLALGCSVNPATGQQQLSFYNEQEEIAMGKEADADIVGKIGLYDDPAVQAYVSELGMKLAAGSERPKLPWSFKVLDDSAINAFALPGGYVYVTRGILTHLGSEAELARSRIRIGSTSGYKPPAPPPWQVIRQAKNRLF